MKAIRFLGICLILVGVGIVAAYATGLTHSPIVLAAGCFSLTTNAFILGSTIERRG